MNPKEEEARLIEDLDTTVRVLITGSRSWGGASTVGRTARQKWQANILIAQLDGIATYCQTNFQLMHLIHGGCPNGADRLATQWYSNWKTPGIHMTVFEADWEAHPKRAGFIRNEEMVATMDPTNPDHFAIAAWDGSSPGTQHCVGALTRRGILTFMLGASKEPQVSALFDE